MAWRVADKIHAFARLLCPVLKEGELQATLDILWNVITTHGRRFVDEFFDAVDVVCKWENTKSLTLLDVSVTDKADAHAQVSLVFALFNDIVNDVIQRFLGRRNPCRHRRGAIHEQCDFQCRIRLVILASFAQFLGRLLQLLGPIIFVYFDLD